MARMRWRAKWGGVVGAIVWLATAPGCEGAGGRGTDAGEGGGEEGDSAGEDEATGEGDAEDGEAEVEASPTPCERVTEATVETVALLAAGRYAPAAAILEGGGALIAGGYEFERGAQRSAEVFDGATGTLLATGNLRQARNFPATAVTRGGEVLVFGGFHPSFGSDNKVEIYDPAAGSFRFGGNAMGVGREAHTATLLPDGRVLVAGGLQAIGFEFHSSAEIYDPAAESFVATAAPMNAPRAFHAAALLASGEAVLVVGGDSGSGELATAERYVLADGSFWNVPVALAHAAKAPAVAGLPDGTVLVAGGANATDGTLADATVYDEAGDRFEPVAPMAVRRMAHTLTALADGRVLAAGGWSDTEVPSASTGALEVFDPESASWTTLPVRLERPRHDHVALLLPDCRVLVAGGQSVVSGGVPVAPLELEIVTVPAR
ncbi:MAG: hypothetical protein HY905_19190 [Deltaproteobacteria bacterium]|nr:hypothetical protein [Deltaproteobacteria bacterium]